MMVEMSLSVYKTRLWYLVRHWHAGSLGSRRSGFKMSQQVDHLEPRRQRREEKSRQNLCSNSLIPRFSIAALVSSPDLIRHVYHLQYNTCDTESDPLLGWFGPGTETIAA